MKHYSASLDIKEMKIKPKVRYYYIPFEMTTSGKTGKPKC